MEKYKNHINYSNINVIPIKIVSALNGYEDPPMGTHHSDYWDSSKHSMMIKVEIRK